MNNEEKVKLCNQLLLFATKEAITAIENCVICSKPVEHHEICLCGWEEDPYIIDGFSYANHETLQKAKERWNKNDKRNDRI